MNDPVKAVTGASLIGLVAVFAMYGKQFWESALGAWLFLLKITETAPLGLASFFTALLLGTLLNLALRRWVPLSRNPEFRSAALEVISLAGAVLVAWVQLHTLNGLLFGILAGLMAPLLARTCAAATRYVKGRFFPDPKAQ